MFPVFISNAYLQSVLIDKSVSDETLITSFFRYVDTFEKEAIQSVMNGENEPDEESLDIALGVFSRCQSNSLPTKKNIHDMWSTQQEVN